MKQKNVRYRKKKIYISRKKTVNYWWYLMEYQKIISLLDNTLQISHPNLGQKIRLK